MWILGHIIYSSSLYFSIAAITIRLISFAVTWITLIHRKIRIPNEDVFISS